MTRPTEIIQGRRYIFKIESENCIFSIKAQCKSTKRYSYINNLNVVLSEFRIDIDNPKIAESTWEVREDEVSSLVNTAKAFLADTAFLPYVEKQLDLDRELGEWGSNKGNRSISVGKIETSRNFQIWQY
jgi:hypothetical protein